MAMNKLLSPWTIALAVALPDAVDAHAPASSPAANPSTVLWDLDAPNTTAVAAVVEGLALRDFDGDGFEDLVTADTDSFSFHRGDGTPGFPSGTRFTVPSGFRVVRDTLVAGDLDADGSADDIVIGLVSIASGESALLYVLDVGGATPTQSVVTLPGRRGLTHLDVGADGSILAGNEGTLFQPDTAGAVRVMSGGTQIPVTGNTDKARRVRFVHLDGDSTPDAAVLVQRSSGDQILTYKGASGGSLIPQGQLVTGGTLSTQDMVWADIDGDSTQEPQWVVSDILSTSSFFGFTRRIGTTGFDAADYAQSSASLDRFVVTLRVQDTESLSIPGHRSAVDATVVDGLGNIVHLRGFDEQTGTFAAREDVPTIGPVGSVAVARIDDDDVIDVVVSDAAAAEVHTARGNERAHTIRYGVDTCGGLDLDAPTVLTDVPGDITLDNTQPGAFCVLIFTDGAAPTPIPLNPDCQLNGDLNRSICNVVLRASGTQARYTVRAPASATGGQVDVQGAGFNAAGRYLSILDFSNSVRLRVAPCGPP